MSLTAFKGRCPHCGHDHGQNTFEVALGTLTPSEQARLDEQFANYAKQKPHLYGGEGMSDLDDVTAKACSKKIADPREQVEKLTKERDSLTRTLEHMEHTRDVEQARHREMSAAMREQLAGLAGQIEKMKEVLKTVVDDAEECTDHDDWTAMLLSLEAYHIASTCMEEIDELPDLATPVLNRIRAEGVRKASTLVSLVRNDWASAGDSLSVQAAEYLISALDARAVELEKTNG